MTKTLVATPDPDDPRRTWVDLSSLPVLASGQTLSLGYTVVHDTATGERMMEPNVTWRIS